jgi:RHS repeat-associated protein
VTNDAGTVVYAAAHDPYGGIQQTWVNTFDPTPKFSGKERDGESELDYFGARYYDREQYRFISVDPSIILEGAMSTPQMWNLCSYCGNNPITYRDPTGRWWTVEVHGIYTYKIAAYVGLPHSIAKAISIADMNIDMNFFTSSTDAGLFSKELRQRWHFPTAERLEEVRRLAHTTLDPKTLGECLHVIQDSYSHAGFESSHIENLNVDDPNYNWDVTMNMAMETLEILSDFQARFWQHVEEVIAGIVAEISGERK